MKSAMLDSPPNTDNASEAQQEHAGPLMELIGVHKFLNGKHILKGIDLKVERGKVTCILGPSGGGKTTLLKCLDLLKLIDIGEIRFNGNLIARAASQDILPWSAVGILNLMAYGTLENRRFKRQLFVKPHEFRRRIAVVFQEFGPISPFWKTLYKVLFSLRASRARPLLKRLLHLWCNLVWVTRFNATLDSSQEDSDSGLQLPAH
jgi:ABC-type branched-subunit amino acid transport system ATPase component